MMTTRQPLRALMTMVSMGVLWVLSAPTEAQPIGSTALTESAEPCVPFLVEPILPAPSIRLQSMGVPMGVEAGGVSTDHLLLPLRLMGVFPFSERVVGEISVPAFIDFAEAGDTTFQLGNPRIGLEAPLLIAGGRTHRVTFSLDLFAPLVQITNSETATEGEEAARERIRYGLMRMAMPTLSPDVAVESLPLVAGFHYRLRLTRLLVQLGLDAPFLIGFDVDGDPLLDEGEILLRYGVMVGFDLKPLYPTLEVIGVSQLMGDVEVETSAQAALGVRYAIQGFEPGLAVTWPMTLGAEGYDLPAYLSLELAYRFQ